MPGHSRFARRRRWRRLLWLEEALAFVAFLGLAAPPFVICGFADFGLFLMVTSICIGCFFLTLAMILVGAVLAGSFETPNPPPASKRINECGEILRDNAPRRERNSDAPPQRPKWPSHHD